MVDPLDDRVELLESTYSSRSYGAVVVVLTAVAVVAVGLVSRTAHSPHAVHHSPPLASPNVLSRLPVDGPRSAAASRTGRRLWVYFEQLDYCTTSNRDRLRVALAVSNLNDKPLRLISAAAVSSSPDLRLKSVQLGTRPCAELTRPAPTTLPSSGEVVALNFTVGPGCPSNRSIDVRVTFAAGSARLHADTLVSLSRVRFLECTPTSVRVGKR